MKHIAVFFDVTEHRFQSSQKDNVGIEGNIYGNQEHCDLANPL
jgi:hypothetical protein